MHEKFEGLRLVDLDTLDIDITGHAIFVNIGAVEDEAVDRRMAQAESEGELTAPTADEMGPFFEEALNNPDNWMRADGEEGARYSLFPIDVASGRVLPNRIAL